MGFGENGVVMDGVQPAEKNRRSRVPPVIDMGSAGGGAAAEAMVRACEEYGFFYVINHGAAEAVVKGLEEESRRFFGRAAAEKERAGPAKPFGYGCKAVGPNGDVGEVEYLLLHAKAPAIPDLSGDALDAHRFRCAARAYVGAAREVACRILELIAEGLGLADASVFTTLLTHPDSDSLLRINHYFPPPSSAGTSPCAASSIGLGEHTDPQILTLLRSNGVGGLQLSVEEGVWIPLPPKPSAFCVNVGDLLQVMTNGRFRSARHRVVNGPSPESRLSVAFFGGPPLQAIISPLAEVVSSRSPSIYKSFTWEEYKRVVYSLRLKESRLHRFRESMDAQLP